MSTVRGARTTTGEKVKVAPAQLTSWSFSRYSDYKQCPKKAKLKHIDRVPEPDNMPREALDRGSRIHKFGEGYVKGEIDEVPENYCGNAAKKIPGFQVQMKDLRAKKARAEESWGFNEKLAPLPDWFHPATWLRIKVDAVYQTVRGTVLTIIDFKTGKMKNVADYLEQLELYALGGLRKFPKVKTVLTDLWFLDHGQMVGAGHDGVGIYQRAADADRLDTLWRSRTRMMLADTVFAPTPGLHCKWCPYSKHRTDSKGVAGICEVASC